MPSVGGLGPCPAALPGHAVSFPGDSPWAGGCHTCGRQRAQWWHGEQPRTSLPVLSHPKKALLGPTPGHQGWGSGRQQELAPVQGRSVLGTSPKCPCLGGAGFGPACVPASWGQAAGDTENWPIATAPKSPRIDKERPGGWGTPSRAGQQECAVRPGWCTRLFPSLHSPPRA